MNFDWFRKHAGIKDKETVWLIEQIVRGFGESHDMFRWPDGRLFRLTMYYVDNASSRGTRHFFFTSLYHLLTIRRSIWIIGL